MDQQHSKPPLVVRFFGCLLVIAGAAFAAWMVPSFSGYIPIFESTVEGGVQSLPVAARLLLAGNGPLLGLVSTLLLLAQVVIWKSRNDLLILVTPLAVALFFLFLVLAPLLILEPIMNTVITKNGTLRPPS